MKTEEQTPTQRVDLQVGEEKLLVQVEQADDEVSQNPAEMGDNKVLSVLKNSTFKLNLYFWCLKPDGQK